MTVQLTFIQNKWADPSNEGEPIRFYSKQGYQTFLWKQRKMAAKLMKKVIMLSLHVMK
jgi:hypothetical protein